MSARRLSLALFVCLLVLCSGSAAARQQQGRRRLLYPKIVSGKLQEAVRLVRDTVGDRAACPRPDWPPGYYLRVAPLKYVLNERGEIIDTAVLGTKPFVFVTTPEDVCGLSLLEIYEQIGYEAESVLSCLHDAKCEKDMVAVVFRYPPDVSASSVCDGALPADWDKKVYATTWDNIFSLFARLADAAEIKPDTPQGNEFAPVKTFFRSAAERYFVLGFPEEGKRRLRTVPYATLKGLGGADWAYRRLLENKLSAFEHFRGNGRTWDEVRDPEGIAQGLSEFVGPNARLNTLEELAVIHLGELRLTTVYDAR